eukprot:NODE_7099_length_473_cov_55.608491_g6284_i0.p1 GENE.NODE_7099_length_473_cov_55.608491_g6284_i0~~NODE_7099_length_473_cov_55.608491_g6284_i0.p1  ORF type:complete len:123 (+),score=39.61 NODE_7099_length_473_cov_55.608491_g6284_i0:24-371(+)
MGPQADELACTYACMILHDGGLEITADRINAILSEAGVKVEGYYPALFADFVSKNDLGSMIGGVVCGGGGGAAAPAAGGGGGGGEAPAAASKKEEKKKEESDEEEEGDMGFGLFD